MTTDSVLGGPPSFEMLIRNVALESGRAGKQEKKRETKQRARQGRERRPRAVSGDRSNECAGPASGLSASLTGYDQVQACFSACAPLGVQITLSTSRKQHGPLLNSAHHGSPSIFVVTPDQTNGNCLKAMRLL